MDTLDVNTQLVVYKMKYKESKTDYLSSIRENERLRFDLEEALSKCKELEAKLRLARACYEDTRIKKGEPAFAMQAAEVKDISGIYISHRCCGASEA